MAKIKLPVEQQADLMQAERDLHDLIPDLDAFEKCGGDAGPFKAIILDATQRIQNLRKYFGDNAQ